MRLVEGIKLSTPDNHILPVEKQKERAILIGLVIGLATLLPFIFIAIRSQSVMLQAEAFRSGNETFAILLSWIALILIRRNPDRFIRLEHQVAAVVSVAMMLSAVIIIVTALKRFETPKLIDISGGLLGVGAGVFSASVNGWLWRKHQRISIQTGSPIMTAQWNLFRSKFFINISVLTTLIASLSLRNVSIIKHLDPMISVLLSLFIFLSAYKLLTNSKKNGK